MLGQFRCRIIVSLVAVCSPLFVSEAGAADASEAFAGLRGWSGGKENASVAAVRSYVDRATKVYEVRVDAERRLVEVIESKDVAKPAKTFAAEQLYRLCDEDTIPAFERMLAKADTWDLACKGLEKIDFPKAGQALIAAAESAKGDKLLAIVAALGKRRDPGGVTTLRVIADEGDARTTEAALTSLGMIPGKESMEALDWCRKNLSRKMRPAATEAYLQCGFTSLEAGDKATAIALFEALLLDFETADVQAEGLRGLIKAKGEDAVPTIIEALTSGVPELESVAAAEAHTVPGRRATEAFIAAYPDLTMENQAVLLRALGDRRDEAALQTVMLAAQSRIPVVRLAALDALGRFNHPKAVQVLLKALVTGSAEEQKVAHEALAKLDAPTLNDELLVAAMSADNTVRAEAIKSIAERQVHEAVPVLLRLAERDVKPVRLEALKALGTVGSAEELAPMVNMLTNEWTDEERAAIGAAIISVARRAPAGKTRTEAIAKSLTASSGNEGVKLTLVSILGAIEDDASLPALEGVAKKPGGRVQRAAIETISGWPNPGPLETLDRVVKGDKDIGMRAAAIEGVLGHLERNPGLPEAQRLKYCQNLAAAAQTPEHRQRIAQALTSVTGPDAEELRQKLLAGE